MKMEVKICGLTNAEDAKVALDCGADYLGFVLYPGSPRYVNPAKLRNLLDRIGSGHNCVAVFVNEARASVERIAAACGLYAVQIHGDEEAAGFENMPMPVWRAVRSKAGIFSPNPDQWPAARYVIDAPTQPRNRPDAYGGTGVATDWTTASAFARKYPIMLAGGLTPANVRDAISAVRPLGVDVCSGVEAKPGRKDHDKLREFIRNAKEAA